MKLRLLFGLVGLVACAATAVIGEGVLASAGLRYAVTGRRSPPLLYRAPLERQVELAGGEGGDVQITLAWHNRNDLDLWCFDPSGHHIWFEDRTSPTGGALDVDANAHTPFVTNPVEHIRWPYGGAPAGQYTVDVHYFANHGDPDPTPYTVQVMEHGRLHAYSGALEPGETRQVGQFVVPYTPLSALSSLWPLVRAALAAAVWAALLGAALAAALLLAQQRLYRRRYRKALATPGQVRTAICVAAAGAAVAGALGQAVYSALWPLVNSSAPDLARAFGWVAMASLAGAAVAFRMPNMRVGPAAVAGALTGILGESCFATTLGTGSDSFGRIAAAAIFGLLVGLTVGLALEPVEEPHYLAEETFNLAPMRLRPMRARILGGSRIRGG